MPYALQSLSWNVQDSRVKPFRPSLMQNSKTLFCVCFLMNSVYVKPAIKKHLKKEYRATFSPKKYRRCWRHRLISTFNVHLERREPRRELWREQKVETRRRDKDKHLREPFWYLLSLKKT